MTFGGWGRCSGLNAYVSPSLPNSSVETYLRVSGGGASGGDLVMTREPHEWDQCPYWRDPRAPPGPVRPPCGVHSKRTAACEPERGSTRLVLGLSASRTVRIQGLSFESRPACGIPSRSWNRPGSCQRTVQPHMKGRDLWLPIASRFLPDGTWV